MTALFLIKNRLAVWWLTEWTNPRYVQCDNFGILYLGRLGFVFHIPGTEPLFLDWSDK